jgi:hypothetical protein
MKVGHQEGKRHGPLEKLESELWTADNPFFKRPQPPHPSTDTYAHDPFFEARLECGFLELSIKHEDSFGLLIDFVKLH